MIKVVLDPGHGQNQNKGVNSGYWEGNYMFTYAYLLKTALEKFSDVAVAVTRSAVIDNPGLTARGKSGAGADLLYSLHSNAASAADARGVTVFYSVDIPGDKSFAAELGAKVAAVMGTYLRGAKVRESEKYPGEDYYTVIDSAQDSGCKHVILLEHGFHTNPDECAWLANEANLAKMADVEAAVIAAFFGLSAVAPEPVPGPAPDPVEPTPEPAEEPLYRVQVGAFRNKQNAENLKAELIGKGYSAIVVQVNK